MNATTKPTYVEYMPYYNPHVLSHEDYDSVRKQKQHDELKEKLKLYIGAMLFPIPFALMILVYLCN